MFAEELEDLLIVLLAAGVLFRRIVVFAPAAPWRRAPIVGAATILPIWLHRLRPEQ